MNVPRRCYVCAVRMARHHGRQVGWGVMEADGRLFVCSDFCHDALNKIPESKRGTKLRLRLQLLPEAKAKGR